MMMMVMISIISNVFIIVSHELHTYTGLGWGGGTYCIVHTLHFNIMIIMNFIIIW